jgi:radical SAM protein with 4Fe4S-binding SPASM domain
MQSVVGSKSGTQEFMHAFGKRVTQQRIPLSGSMDLTHRCNLRCVHCYLDPAKNKNLHNQKELQTEEFLRILDEVADAGCLYLLLTGGEPLARKDFAEIYRHAKLKGLIITIFTNGTLISEAILELFDDLPPKAIEVSIYGATRRTYESVTDVKGSYDRCISGINRLIEHDLNLRLKTILMTANRHEFDAMEQMAKDFGVPFRFDAALFPRFNGDLMPLDLRVPVEEAFEKEFSDPQRREEWGDFYAQYGDIPSSDAKYQCGAGLSYFHIDAFGNLQACLMNVENKISIKNKSFLEGWNGGITSIREEKLQDDHVCGDCSKRVLCGYCPPFFQLETNSDSAISNFMCSMGQLRYEGLRRMPDRRGT